MVPVFILVPFEASCGVRRSSLLTSFDGCPRDVPNVGGLCGIRSGASPYRDPYSTKNRVRRWPIQPPACNIMQLKRGFRFFHKKPRSNLKTAFASRCIRMHLGKIPTFCHSKRKCNFMHFRKRGFLWKFHKRPRLIDYAAWGAVCRLQRDSPQKTAFVEWPW